MNLPILILLGIVGAVCAIYKTPANDACARQVVICDKFKKRFAPADNFKLEMVQSIEQLNAVCDELSEYRTCLKITKAFCDKNAEMDLGFSLLESRHLAFDLCEPDSVHRHMFMMVEKCVNKYAFPSFQFCLHKSNSTLAEKFLLRDLESHCIFLLNIQHCRVAIVTDQCGSIAGNMFEKLLVFHAGLNFMCLEYENEMLKDLETYYTTMDSYAQEFREKNSIKTERVGRIKIFKTPQQEVFSLFHSPISTKSAEYLTSNNEFERYREQHFSLETTHYTESEYTTQNSVQHTKPFYEERSHKVLIDNKYDCKTKALFSLMGVHPTGEHYQLGYGVADVSWATFLPLRNLSCVWMENLSEPLRLGKCSILLDDSAAAVKDFKSKVKYNLTFNTTIAVYENEIEYKMVAELRVHNFLKYSSSLEERLDNLFSKNHAHDFRFWCAEQHNDYLSKEPHRVHSTSRIGTMPHDDHQYVAEDEPSRFLEQKYNFYESEQTEYPIDTEIHLISSVGGSLENEFEVEDNYASQNNDEAFNPFLNHEMLKGRNRVGPSTPRPTIESSPFQSYRPYELYRPRLGEIPEVEKLILSEDKEVEESSFNPNVFPKDAIENGCKIHLYANEICPAQLENVSKLYKKPGMYSRINYMNIDDPIGIVEPKRYKIWETEEPQKIATNNKQNQFEEIYVLTPSAEIEMARVPKQTVTKDAGTHFR